MIINQVVSGGGGSSVAEPYIEYSVDASGNLVSTTSRIADFTGVKYIGYCQLGGAYAGNTNVSGVVNLGDLEEINGDYGCARTFYDCTGITGINIEKLKKVYAPFGTSYMFYRSGITSIVFDSLEEMYGTSCCQYMCAHCSNLTTAKMPKLKAFTLNGSLTYGFAYTALTTMEFPSLESCASSMCLSGTFTSCSSLSSLWFYALKTTSFGSITNQFNQMLQGCTGVTVHFPMAIQATIGSWRDVTNGFGGTNTTVLFDLVTSLTGADGNTYTRSEKDSTSTATAWLYNDTLYYTSGVSNHTAGVNEAQVGDTIYSDSACTTAVTTISSIA